MKSYKREAPAALLEPPGAAPGGAMLAVGLRCSL